MALKAVRWAIGVKVRDTGRMLATAKKMAGSNGTGHSVARPVEDDEWTTRLGTNPSPGVLGKRG